MNDSANLEQRDLELSDEDLYFAEASDEALEAAAGAITQVPVALSFPSAPTVSILVICCTND